MVNGERRWKWNDLTQSDVASPARNVTYRQTSTPAAARPPAHDLEPVNFRFGFPLPVVSVPCPFGWTRTRRAAQDGERERQRGLRIRKSYAPHRAKNATSPTTALRTHTLTHTHRPASEGRKEGRKGRRQRRDRSRSLTDGAREASVFRPNSHVITPQFHI